MQGRRQGGEQFVQPEDAHRLRRITLRTHIGEGGARLGQVGGDGAGQAEAQPVLAADDVADPAEALRSMLLQPGEQGGRRRGVRGLAGQSKGLGKDRTLFPSLHDLSGAAVERQDARP